MTALTLPAMTPEACPEHGACEVCETELCASCEIGERSSCGHQAAALMCEQCALTECPDCVSQARADLCWPERRYV